MSAVEICSRCGLTKPINEFYRRPDGRLRQPCKRCILQRNREGEHRRLQDESYRLALRSKDRAKKAMFRGPLADADLDPEKLQSAIASCVCVCGDGPFKVLAMHMKKAHGVDGFELRDRAGLLVHTPVCDPEISEQRRKANLARNSAVHLTGRPKGASERVTSAGKRGRRTGAPFATGLVAPNTFRGEKNGNARLTESDVAEIRRMYQAGVLQRVIAVRFGIGQTTVSRLVRGASWRHLADARSARPTTATTKGPQ